MGPPPLASDLHPLPANSLKMSICNPLSIPYCIRELENLWKSCLLVRGWGIPTFPFDFEKTSSHPFLHAPKLSPKQTRRAPLWGPPESSDDGKAQLGCQKFFEGVCLQKSARRGHKIPRLYLNLIGALPLPGNIFNRPNHLLGSLSPLSRGRL